MSPSRLSRLESAVRLILEFTAAFNRHDVPAMMRLMSDDCRFEPGRPAADGAVYTGQEAVSRYWETFFRDSPRAHLEIEEIFGLGLRCVMRWQYEWVDAAGETRRLRGVDLYQVKRGAICEQLSYVKE